MFKHLINIIAPKYGLMPVADHVELLADATHDVAALEADLDAARMEIDTLRADRDAKLRQVGTLLETMWAQKEAA